MSLSECLAKLGFQISSAIQWKSDQGFALSPEMTILNSKLVEI